MPVVIDIADRLYDYTDEEKAAEAISDFQSEHDLSDQDILLIWSNTAHPMRAEMEKLIFDAIDANGSVRRANESIPSCIELFLEE